MKKHTVLVLLMVLFAAVRVAGSVDVPYLTGRVNDIAGILSKDAVTFLSDKLKAHEERTTNQVVILTIPSLQGESIEDYSNRGSTNGNWDRVYRITAYSSLLSRMKDG